MRAHMTHEGRLVVTPESGAEVVALREWWNNWQSQWDAQARPGWAVIEISLTEREDELLDKRIRP